MARKKTDPPPADDGPDLTAALDAVVPAGPAPADPGPPPAPPPPAYGSAEWSGHVMARFLADELYDGLPNVEGLRRVAEELLGPVVASVTQVVQSPGPDNQHHAACVHTVTVRFWDGTERAFSGAADVHLGNVDNPVFGWQYSLATCETRAESRAFKRALRLRHVCAAEEVGGSKPDQLGLDGFMSETQATVLGAIAKRIDLNLMKYLNSGKGKYPSAADVPYQTAVKALGHIQQYQQNPAGVPPELRGFDPKWRK